MGPMQWALTKLGLWQSRGVKGKKANLARGHIHAVAMQRKVRDQSSLGAEEWKLFLLRCVSSCEQMQHLKDQVRCWIAQKDASKDVNKVSIALERSDA